MNDKKKKDLLLIAVQCVTALLGAVSLLLGGKYELLIFYGILMFFSIFCLYFNDSICRTLTRQGHWKRPPTEDDYTPSETELKAGKIIEWVVFCIALIVAIAASF